MEAKVELPDRSLSERWGLQETLLRLNSRATPWVWTRQGFRELGAWEDNGPGAHRLQGAHQDHTEKRTAIAAVQTTCRYYHSFGVTL